MIITIKGLEKEYNDRKVVDIPDFVMDCQGKTAIIGPNGAGKSTLVNILAGLEEPTAGSLKYDGSCEIPYKNITLVFQRPYLISGTVEMNVKYPLKLRKLDKDVINMKADALLEELGIVDYRKQKTWTLSGGEAQKVALARALAVDPKLLMLDEPTTSIDPKATFDIEKILNDVCNKYNINILMVTHNIAQAKRLCDNVIFMHKGKIIEYGKTEEILYNPQNQLTKRFIEGEIVI
jgi:tungstate transport system ATP-binding protein